MRSQQHPSGTVRSGKTTAALILIVAVFVAGLAGGALACVHRMMPSGLSLATYQPQLTTEIYSTELQPNGQEDHTLLARVFKEGEDREPAELRQIPAQLIQATVAIEDHRFYQHRGVSPVDVVRAVFANLRAHHIVQGGSTITQQVVRNIWLTQNRTYQRKIKEIVLALAVERTYSKDEILEMYLNEVYYGHGAYGVKVAAKMFFGKQVGDLSLAQCALLAGIPQRPSLNSPYVNPQAARQRRHQVLMAMLDQGYITASQAQAADKEDIQTKLQPLKPRGVAVLRAPHFTHLVIRQLCEQYGTDTVYQGGLRVYTTLDMRVQDAATEEVTRAVERMRRNGEVRGGLVGQAALVCTDVRTGAVLAMVGGVGPYEKVQYNRAYPGPPQYGRQPGSSFKPYVWTTALESGYGPDSRWSGASISIPTGNGKYWEPKNAEGGGGGNYSLASALAHSVNLVSVRIVRKVGGDSVIRYAARMMDIPEGRMHNYPSLALGVFGLAPVEQTTGFSTIANGGIRCQRQFVRRIEDYQGSLLLVVEPQRERVMREDVAISMIRMMRGVVTEGTGTRANIPGYEKVCGKTGTTNDKRDAWWVGFTPDLCCAVWVGNDNFAPMPDGFGGHLAAPIFRSFMSRALKVLKCDGDFPSGAEVEGSKRGVTTSDNTGTRTVRICLDSGGLAGPNCPRTELHTFKAGQALPGPCRMHRGPGARSGGSEGSRGDEQVTVPICVESGGLAGPYCPQVTERTMSRSAVPGRCRVHRGGGEPAATRPEPSPSTTNTNE